MEKCEKIFEEAKETFFRGRRDVSREFETHEKCCSSYDSPIIISCKKEQAKL